MSFKSLTSVFKRNYIPVSSYVPQKGFRPHVFVEFKIDNNDAGRVVFELYGDSVPRTAENFRRICNGDAKGTKGNALSYKNSIIYKVIPGLGIYGGDITKNNGQGGESIYGETFKDEAFTAVHDRPGLLTTVNNGINTNTSQFMVTMGPTAWLNYKSVIFGEVVSGMDVLAEIERAGTKDAAGKKITISNTGEIERPVDDHHDDHHH